jgi:hypothetical protein
LDNSESAPSREVSFVALPYSAVVQQGLAVQQPGSATAPHRASRAASSFRVGRLYRLPSKELSMPSGLYIAASGMNATLSQQDVIANNLANVSTVGFKQNRSRLIWLFPLILISRLKINKLKHGRNG